MREGSRSGCRKSRWCGVSSVGAPHCGYFVWIFHRPTTVLINKYHKSVRRAIFHSSVLRARENGASKLVYHPFE